MELTRVDDDEGVVAWQRVADAVHTRDYEALPADAVEDLRAVLAGDGAAAERSELWLGLEAGLVVGVARLDLPTRDNLTAAEVLVEVHPDHRRRGHGTALLDAAVERCRAIGRTQLLALVPGHLDGAPSAGDRLARAAGFEPRLADVRRLLDLGALDLAAVQARWDEARTHAPGYEVVSWAEHAPADCHAGLAALAGRMSTDAPQGDLEREPEVWDAARWAAREAAAAARGRLCLGSLVRRDGDVVAYCDMGIARSQPTVGFQWDLLVRPDHRGHRIGMLLKTVNLQLLRDRSPGTRWLVTWNAASNTHMIAINEQLGFRAVDRWTECQRFL